MSGSSKEKSDLVDNVIEITETNKNVSDMEIDSQKCNVKAFQWFYERDFDNFF